MQTATEFPPVLDLAGLSVLVIGAEGGVGPAVVAGFDAHGARTCVGLLAADAAPPGGRPALAVPQGCVDDPAALRGFLDRCDAVNGPVEVVAYVSPPVTVGRALELDDAAYARVIRDELLLPVLLLRESARRMAARGFGRLLSFCSMSGKTGVHPGVSPYAAAKGGLIAFSRSLAAELAPQGVTVNVIATALFDVQVNKTGEALHEVVKGIPVGRVGRSQEAAAAALFLASRQSGYITGETVNMSGGRFMD
ncbi:3-oxoacyl-[acyl-carrier-protein] reductase FabG [Pigmentiphaga humi]|uniref:3-oxoacyl-[acyl-carrier-protein] reductase FabG n=1 Tax=Pigmentiphaga humi TaxID=2478468 RepID=A0A3P4B6Z4_9BURK|nr:SDR family oxidoreductase [Pigmentiphaga humi]VCU71286.1 3-oxoacyl-[acyl-carrier-protein] reductase FabG [Pigmentiphaga humi]